MVNQLSLASGQVERLDLPPDDSVISCACGESFCSAACLEEALEGAHGILCVAADSHAGPLVRFKEHAIEANEIFLMAADTLCWCLQQEQLGRWVLPPSAVATPPSSPAQADVSMALPPPLNAMVCGDWVDVAAPASNPRNARVRTILREQLGESWELLREVFVGKVRAGTLPASPFARLLSQPGALHLFSALIGLFELNTIDVQAPSPLQHMLDVLAAAWRRSNGGAAAGMVGAAVEAAAPAGPPSDAEVLAQGRVFWAANKRLLAPLVRQHREEGMHGDDRCWAGDADEESEESEGTVEDEDEEGDETGKEGEGEVAGKDEPTDGSESSSERYGHRHASRARDGGMEKGSHRKDDPMASFEAFMTYVCSSGAVAPTPEAAHAPPASASSSASSPPPTPPAHPVHSPVSPASPSVLHAPAPGSPATVPASSHALRMPAPRPLFEPLRGRALFPRVACANHSCRPNTALLYEPATGPLRGRLVAVAPIRRGEEICISYIDQVGAMGKGCGVPRSGGGGRG